jgi:hypothetical protein
MADEDKHVDKSLPTPPTEPDISLPGVHTWRLQVWGSDARDVCWSVRKGLSDHLLGKGRVEIDKIVLRFTASAAGQYVYAGIVNALASRSAKQVGATPGGISHVSNAYNSGVMHEHVLLIPGNVSRQIQPVSSLLPDFNFCLSHSNGVNVNVTFEMRVYGDVIEYFDAAAVFVGQAGN